jgi:intracellular sulfur oxidation DsrE/DsrF family protein
MKSSLLKAGTAIAFGLAVVAAQPAFSAEGHSMADHKIVFQISSSDPVTQNLVLNNAVNIRKHYGPDNVDVVVVAYGPGLTLLTKANKQAARVKSLAVSGITFDACNNTMKAMEKKTGKKPVLTEGVKVVPAGIADIVELQEKGYKYIRP